MNDQPQVPVEAIALPEQVNHLTEAERHRMAVVDEIKIRACQTGAGIVAAGFAVGTLYAVNKYGGDTLVNLLTDPAEHSDTVNGVIRAGTFVGSVAAAAYTSTVGTIVSITSIGAVGTSIRDRLVQRKARLQEL